MCKFIDSLEKWSDAVRLKLHIYKEGFLIDNFSILVPMGKCNYALTAFNFTRELSQNVLLTTGVVITKG